MTGRKYTLTHSHPVPTYEKLDFIRMDITWEEKSLGHCTALKHIVPLQVHGPLILTTHVPRSHGKRRFKFELGWLHCDGFDMVKQSVG